MDEEKKVLSLKMSITTYLSLISYYYQAFWTKCIVRQKYFLKNCAAYGPNNMYFSKMLLYPNNSRFLGRGGSKKIIQMVSMNGYASRVQGRALGGILLYYQCFAQFLGFTSCVFCVIKYSY